MTNSNVSNSKDENNGDRPRVLPISALTQCPVRVRLHTQSFVEGIVSSLEADKPVQGIVVASVGDKKYIVDGHARVDAYRAAGLAEVIVDEELVFSDVSMVVAEHVNRNATSTLNPLSMANAVAYLVKHGVKDPYSALPMGQAMKRAVQLILGAYDAGTRAMLQKYLLEKSAVFPDVDIPPQFFIAVYECSNDASAGKGEQERRENVRQRMKVLVQYILDYMSLMRTHERFVFPTPDQIVAMAAALKQKKAFPQPGMQPQQAVVSAGTGSSTSLEEYSGGDGDGDDGGNDIGNGFSAAGQAFRKAVLPDGNKSVVSCIHCGKEQVIDLSTGAVCRIEDYGPVRVIKDDSGGKEIFCLSQQHADYLGLSSGTIDVDDIKQLVTDRKSEVEKFLKKVSIATRFVVIAVDHDVR